MQDAHFNNSFESQEEDVNIKEVLFKYLRFWPWFIAAVTIALLSALFYLKYTPTVYNTEAKIKIIDDSKELNIGADALSMLSGKPKINLDNEIEVLKSYRLLSQVVESLNLQVDYLIEGNIKTTPIWGAPFKVIHSATADTLNKTHTYAISWDETQYHITDDEGRSFNQSKGTAIPIAGLPFYILSDANQNTPDTKKYKVTLKPFKQTVMNLAKNIEVQSTNKNSEILAISLKGVSVERSEAIINEIIEMFNNDGIQDRQLVSKRTLNFIDERFVFLSEELDSIEGNKKIFKQNNNLSYIEADAGVNLQKKSESEAELFRIDTQIELSNLLKKTLTNDAPYNLLPANIGLESTAINDLVSQYNQSLLEREKMLASAGSNNPTVKILNVQLSSAKANIERTVTVYAQQLKMSLKQLQREKGRVGAQFSSLPEKEQLLRAIERQQSIKENLYLILLQKREEAAISLAVTAPSIKVVDYALTSSIPVAPKSKIILLGAIILGLLIPFSILYIIFMLDTKIHNKQEVEALIRPIPVVAEIPFIEGGELFINPDARSTVAEAFRMLMTNVNYTLPPTETQKAKVIYITSTIKGEGKTFTAVNLSLAYTSLDKRVLLIGADIRNPQIHTYFQLNKDQKGLTTYLFNPKITAEECIIKNGLAQGNLHLMLGGSIPPNPASLLSNGRFKSLLKELQSEYDVIIVDTAPTVLVTDTLLISKYADATVYVAKANYTDKNLLEIPKKLHDEKKLQNIVFIINNAGQNNHYSYNYNYGYGYNEDNLMRLPWYKRLFKR